MALAATHNLARSPLAQPFAFAWNAWRRMTVAHLRYATLFWLVWGSTVGLSMLAFFPRYEAWVPITTGLYDTFLVTAVLLLGIVVADACPPSRAPPWLPYAAAAVVADVLGSILIVFTEPMVGIQCCWDGPRPADAVFLGAGIGSNLVVCSLATFGYYHRQREMRRAAALRSVQVERTQLARRAFEARLQAMQARVEPRFLFNTLAQVERLYEIDTQRADRMLDDLIVYLRAALPQLRETTSTLNREIELAKAYLNIVEAGAGDRLSLDRALLDQGADVRVPPMLLLPLLEYVLADRGTAPPTEGSIDIAMRVGSGKLSLTVTDTAHRSRRGDDGSTTLQGIRERLAALYGTAASLKVDHDGSARLWAVVEIPYEHVDDRSHR